MGGTTLVEELETAANDVELLVVKLNGKRGCEGYLRAAALRARAARIRESLDSITRAAGTPQNRAVKDWLLDLTGPLSPTDPSGGDGESGPPGGTRGPAEP